MACARTNYLSDNKEWRQIKMENVLITLGEAFDALADWIYSITSGFTNGDIEPPEEMSAN